MLLQNNTPGCGKSLNDIAFKHAPRHTEGMPKECEVEGCGDVMAGLMLLAKNWFSLLSRASCLFAISIEALAEGGGPILMTGTVHITHD